jgi:hypothetical protein
MLAQSFAWGVHEGQPSGDLKLAGFGWGVAGEFQEDDFTARVVWGDGAESPGDVRHTHGNHFEIYGSHTFQHEGFVNGAKVFVDMPATGATPAKTLEVAHGRFTVMPAPLSGQVKSLNPQLCVPFKGVVATFQDLDPQGPEARSHYNATIFWGDGKTDTNAKIKQSGNTFQVYGEHTYREARSRTITVEVKNNRSERTGELYSDASIFVSRTRVSRAVVVKDGTSIELVDGVLKVQGDKNPNDAKVRLSAGVIQVVMLNIGPKDCSNYKSKSVPAEQVKSIVIQGDAGNDHILTDVPNIPVTIRGGAGNDRITGGAGKEKMYGDQGDDYLRGGANKDCLFGGPGDDTLYGGAGDDCIYGGADNDNLYGGPGADKLYGQDGLDGLYGGDGVDELFGGPQPDRFLVSKGFTSNEQKDAAGEDAVIHFANGDALWTPSQIEQVDGGLRVAHLLVQNDNLLETAGPYRDRQNGGAWIENAPPFPLTFVRDHRSLIEKGRLAENENNGSGRIHVFDAVFAAGTGQVKVTVMHEIAHNWDEEQAILTAPGEATGMVDRWLSHSGWVNVRPDPFSLGQYEAALDSNGKPTGWWYLNTAVFARDYGKSYPVEDWATAWESYLHFDKALLPNTRGVVPLSEKDKNDHPNKVDHLDEFFRRLAARR